MSAAARADTRDEALGQGAEAATRSGPAKRRPAVNTFDVFDTLIARRCIDPVGVFHAIAERSGLGNFVAARLAAERAVAHGPYDLATIYATLAEMFGLSGETAAELQAMEVEIEIENVIPVCENIAALGDGDILVSDMYLGAPVIRRLLDAAGIGHNVPLVVTTDGKHKGWIWPPLLDKFEIKEHLGDNPQSDNVVPQRFGIATRHTGVTAPNFVERTLIEAGLRDLALLCREARLINFAADPHIHALKAVQTSLNVPLLVLASLALCRRVQRRGLSAVLFSSRDCNLWLAIFRAVADQVGVTCRTDYFYTSRVARTQPSDDYLAYAREGIAPGTIVVDICGSGWSLAHLFDRMGLADQEVFFLHKLAPIDLYERRAATPKTCVIHALLDGDLERCSGVALEMSNYAAHGMVLDVRDINGVAAPVFAPDTRPRHIREAIDAQRAACLSAADLLSRRPLRETFTLDDASIAVLCTALYQGLSNQQILQQVFAQQHHLEDLDTLRTLGVA